MIRSVCIDGSEPVPEPTTGSRSMMNMMSACDEQKGLTEDQHRVEGLAGLQFGILQVRRHIQEVVVRHNLRLRLRLLRILLRIRHPVGVLRSLLRTA